MALQTATNPNTGETVALVGNQWLPVAKTASNDQGQKAYLVNNQWLVDQEEEKKKAAGFSLKDLALSFGQGVGGGHVVECLRKSLASGEWLERWLL
jgi:hypothetical protein